jgi:hypothetical protein
MWQKDEVKAVDIESDELETPDNFKTGGNNK